MENTTQYQTRTRQHPLGQLDRESAQLRRLPHPQDGNETAALGIRPTARLAQELVASLEDSPGAHLRLRRRCQGRHASPCQAGIRRTNHPNTTIINKEKIKWKTHASPRSILTQSPGESLSPVGVHCAVQIPSGRHRCHRHRLDHDRLECRPVTDRASHQRVHNHVRHPRPPVGRTGTFTSAPAPIL